MKEKPKECKCDCKLWDKYPALCYNCTHGKLTDEQLLQLLDELLTDMRYGNEDQVKW